MDPSGSESEHVLFAGTYNFKVKWLLHVLLKFLCLQLATGNLQAICNDDEETDPQAPECLDDCRGRRFFLDRDGICKMCVQCIAGYEHDKECGNGENGDAICILCPEDHYSYNLYDCVACRVCENTLITQECSASTDRQCGECHPGFYKDPQNPDLCNQRCEWLTNLDTLPACKAWLANHQVTTLSAGISLTSSSPGIIDEGTGRETITIIIIIVLVILVIGGSVIPIYLCCNHCRYSSSTGVVVPGDIEHPEPVDAVQEQGSDCVGTIMNDDGASEVDNVLPLSTGPEQDDDGADGDVIERVRAKPMTNGKFENNPLEISRYLYALGMRNGAHTLRSTESTVISEEDDNGHMPSGSISEGAQISAVGARDDEEDGVKEEPDERSTFHPDASLRSTESTVSGRDDDEPMPMSSDSEVAQRSYNGAEDDEQDGEQDGGKEEPDEHQKLLPDAPLSSTESTAIGQIDDDEHMPTGSSTCTCGNIPNITYQIEHVDNVVMGNQIHNHHSAVLTLTSRE